MPPVVQGHQNREPSSSHRRIGTTTIAFKFAVGLLVLSVLLSSTLFRHSSPTSEKVGPIVANLPINRMLNPLKSLFGNYWGRSAVSNISTSTLTTDSKNNTSRSMAARTPVYFVSHGVSTAFSYAPLSSQC